MSCALDRYDSDHWCAACGARAINIVGTFDFATGHIERTCAKCRFDWSEAPLFDPDEPPIFRVTQTDKICPACSSYEDVESAYMSDPAPDSFELQHWWRITSEGHEYLNAVLGTEVASLVPFLGLRCTRCEFAWPELPLNRAEGPAPVLPPHTCPGEPR